MYASEREEREREGWRERVGRENIVFTFPADEISKLSVQCEEWRSTLDTVQEARAHDRMHTQQLLTTKVHDYEKKAYYCIHVHRNFRQVKIFTNFATSSYW